MTNEAETDHGTVLKPDDWAAIWSPSEGYSLLAPRGHDENPVPDEAWALTAAVMRLEADPVFRRECIEWFNSRKVS